MIVFKLERERPAYDSTAGALFYVKERHVRQHDYQVQHTSHHQYCNASLVPLLQACSGAAITGALLNRERCVQCVHSVVSVSSTVRASSHQVLVMWLR
jgi:hypothetical protein